MAARRTEPVEHTFVREKDGFRYYHGKGIGLYKVPVDQDSTPGIIVMPVSDELTNHRSEPPVVDNYSTDEKPRSSGFFKFIGPPLTAAACLGVMYFLTHPEMTRQIIKGGHGYTQTDSRYKDASKRLAQNGMRLTGEYQKFQRSSEIGAVGKDVGLKEEYLNGSNVGGFVVDASGVVAAKAFDLNDDGNDEFQLVSGPCGNTGCSSPILRWNGRSLDTILNGDISRMGAKTNGYKDLYSVSYSAIENTGDIVESITRYAWNGERYAEDETFSNPNDNQKIAVGILKIASSKRNLRESMDALEKMYGKESLLNGLVIATVGDSGFPMPTDVDYERYLRVLDKETGKDFSMMYREKDPKELADALYGNSVNYGLFDSDPRLMAAMLIGKGIDNAAGGNWKRHLDRMEKAGIGGVAQYRNYQGRDPTPRELENMMRKNVMTDNPYDHEQPGSRSTTKWRNETTGQSGETDQYGRSREQSMRDTVRERQQRIDTQRQQNMDKVRKDAGEAAEAIRKMMQDQMQRNQEKH